MFRKVRMMFDMDDSLHFRAFKIIIGGIPKAIAAAVSVIGIAPFFIGNHNEEGFPILEFWVGTAIVAAVAWCMSSVHLSKTAMADPHMTACIRVSKGTILYFFKKNSGIKENTIVEIRRVQNGRTLPFALAYVEEQDMMHPEELIVRPIAFVEGKKYVQKEPKLISSNKTRNFIIKVGALRKDILENTIQVLHGGDEHVDTKN